MQVAHQLAEANRRIDALLDALEKHHNDNTGYICEVCGMEWEAYSTICMFHDSCDCVDIVGSRRNGCLPANKEPQPCK